MPLRPRWFSGRQRSFTAALLIIAGLRPAAGAGTGGAVDVSAIGADVVLNGTWQTGIDRHYTGTAPVPGLAGDPTQMSPGTLWYQRDVRLPDGDWNRATLTLHGARFAPAVYVDGQEVGASEGGMAPVELPLASAAVKPGRTIRLEVALRSLRDLDPRDASSVPPADRWRSDVSSNLWDSVALHLSRDATITRIIPWTDFPHDALTVHWQAELAGASAAPYTVQAVLLDAAGRTVVSSAATAVSASGAVRGAIPLALQHRCQPWTPDHPVLYRLRLVLREGNRIADTREISWGLRDFRTVGLGFELNGEPVRLRGGSVVWHRWLRDPQARTLAFDPDWFEQNIILRLKHLGANLLRFHLGLPPESFLDRCDRDGMMVQFEWPFFHGITASPASMQRQWRAWLDVAMRHPSVVIIHPWNETDGDQLKIAWRAMDAILPEYPPLVMAHRDVIHIHKYWWSLFENLGLYYDSAAQFDRPIMVDEFGGNYLDYDGNPGAYPTVREALLRFLGRHHTRAQRLQFQAETNARVAEYWRRIGAAGFAPFCILSSPADGNTWFLGRLKDGQPKPVWAALAAAYAERSVSLDVWNRNYSPGEHVTVPVQFFNDSGTAAELTAEVRVVSDDVAATRSSVQRVIVPLAAHATVRRQVPLVLPSVVGTWRLEAELVRPKPTSPYPVVSSWQVRTLVPQVPAELAGAAVGFVADEPELRAFAAQNGLHAVPATDPAARVIVGSTATWARLTRSAELRRQLAAAVDRGVSLVLLDIGPRDLGQGYKRGDLGPLDGAPQVNDPRVETDALFRGVQLTFTEAAEPESHFHPGPVDRSLWRHLPREATWLWNGLRGGLVVPADEMAVGGLSPEAFAAEWANRGADQGSVRGNGPYYAYELAGFYAYSTAPDDKATIAGLRQKVKFLAEDAPALKDRINPEAPVVTTDLRAGYRASASGQATRLVALATAGKNLERVPVVELRFGPHDGRVLLSQVLTAGRLQRGRAEPGEYGLRYDPAAEQFVLNCLAEAVGVRAAGAAAVHPSP